MSGFNPCQSEWKLEHLRMPKFKNPTESALNASLICLQLLKSWIKVRSRKYDECFRRKMRQNKDKRCRRAGFFCAGKSIRLSEVTCLASRSDKKGSTIYFLISSNYSRCLEKCTRQSELNVPSLKFYNQKTLIQIIDQTFQRRDFEGDDLGKK